MATIREASRIETQARVLREADGLFCEQGFTKTTIRDIAAAASVSVGSVMAVGDKSALLVTIFDRLIEDLQLAHPETGTALGSQSDRIMALLAPFVELFISRPELSRTYASILVAGNHSSAIFAKLATMLVEDIRDVVAGDNTDGAELAQAVYLAYLGSLITWAASGTNDVVTLNERLRRTITAICPN